MGCFVIRGFGVKQDSQGRRIDFDKVHNDLIAPALKECELSGGTTGEVVDAGSIHKDMFELILKADIVLCDITVHNPNVFYELGVRHALRKKHTVLIKANPSADTTPFDIAGARYTSYPIDDPASARADLVAAIKSTLARERVTDSPVFLMMPDLPEAQFDHIVMVPPDFVEEVELAWSRADKGWLRVLAEDVLPESFQREGLRVVGRAQWALRDIEAAVDTWEKVRQGHELDPEANLALANLYERRYRSTLERDKLQRSDQAIERMLRGDNVSPAYRSEALALRGRNLKTLWRLEFAKLGTLEERQARAVDNKAKESHEAYKEALEVDLNNFFAGLAAYQMGYILKSLSQHPRFSNLFGGDKKKVSRYLEDLGADLAVLSAVVRRSIDRALKGKPGESLTWAKISDADMLFLTHAGMPAQTDHSDVVHAYRSAVPKGSFYWDAARGQLELFEQLGIGAEAARAVMAELDETKAHIKRHLVIFSGHTVDRTGSTPPPMPRFPNAAQSKARDLIEAELRRLKGEIEDQGEALQVLVSAAPGADILMLEACKALGIETWLCLPVQRDVVAREVFQHYDVDWHNRFFALTDAQPADHIFVLSDTGGLPRWLRTRAMMTPWSRGNRWMMALAQSWGASKVTLLTLWDHNETESSDGTAAMVRLAHNTNLFIRHIDSRQLIAG
ncbi:hypothetical protein SAMN04244573_03782 [Azotobacter beijerinckii]|uniref:DUF4071 domain-containing protein n=1 Tax=Azotobacter beijerinckii TaxID=170623 RepID=A0A1H9PVD1_9GAMM|nr:tetratricopeptide repeat-containing protein [Azotobacter beijerinckii]SER52187.1 hypothetical protein SAMN04244573_03782 [Azotobacter beijerinckii]